MEKDHGGFSADHVMVNGNYLQAMTSKRFQDASDLALQHGDVARHGRVVIITHKGGPCGR